MADESISLNIQMTGIESVDAEFHPAASNSQGRILTHDGFNIKVTFDVNAAVMKPTDIIPGDVTLAGSSQNIDLTAAVKALERTVDLEGKKLFQILAKAHPDNGGDISIGPGDTNPYPLFGAGVTVPLGPGRFIATGETKQFNSPAVADASVQNIKISGTAGYRVQFLFYFGETPS